MKISVMELNLLLAKARAQEREKCEMLESVKVLLSDNGEIIKELNKERRRRENEDSDGNN